MNIFEKIHALLTLKNVIQTELKGATMPTASGKPGYLTTEFYLNLITQIGVLWGAVHGFVPAPWNVIVPVVGTAVYTIARTVAKAVADVKTAKAGGSVTP